MKGKQPIQIKYYEHIDPIMKMQMENEHMKLFQILLQINKK